MVPRWKIATVITPIDEAMRERYRNCTIIVQAGGECMGRMS
jgi:hypothetical protein